MGSRYSLIVVARRDCVCVCVCVFTFCVVSVSVRTHCHALYILCQLRRAPLCVDGFVFNDIRLLRRRTAEHPDLAACTVRLPDLLCWHLYSTLVTALTPKSLHRLIGMRQGDCLAQFTLSELLQQ